MEKILSLLRKQLTPIVIAALGFLMLIGIGGAANAVVQFTKLYDFSLAVFPNSGLTLAENGDFYGDTESGGPDGDGTVYEVTPSGIFTTLYSFSGPDGAVPFGSLTLGSDGNLYGTTLEGGANDVGTIFMMTPQGLLTTLHTFIGSDGAEPGGCLTLGTDGNFYGSTSQGGPTYSLDYGYGTVFKITPSGTFTLLYSFTGTEGTFPNASLTQGRDGDFYGTTFETNARHLGSNEGYGTVFKITPSGVFTSIYTFPGDAGCFPNGALTLGADYNFYGTTSNGGTRQLGTVFKITPSGTVTYLHAFGAEGAYPERGLALGTDGNFYGTTTLGGPNGSGAIFEINPSGVFNTLYSFSARTKSGRNSDGAEPLTLILGADSVFNGIAFGGGTRGSGTIYKFVVSAHPATRIEVVDPQSLPGQAVPLTATIFLTDGLSPLGKTLMFSIDGTSVGAATTDSTGVAAASFMVPQSFAVGYHTIMASFAGDQSDASSMGTGWLAVTNDSLTVVSNFAKRGNPVTLQAKVSAVSGIIPKGSTVKFYIYGELIGTSVTNSGGVAQITYLVPANEITGVHVVSAYFTAAGSYTACTGTGTLTVN